MIITRLKGGMGNQMFQYAMALNVAERLGTELQIDLCSLLDRSKGDFVYRNYDLSIFEVDNKFVMNPNLLKSLSKLKSAGVTKLIRNHINKGRKYIKEADFHFQPEYINQAIDNTIYEGWFQSHRYFEGIEDLLRKKFSFKGEILPKSQSLLKKIKSTNSICLNVRRTDFLKVDNLNTTDLSYFLKAASEMIKQVKQPEFFIFSDDVEWCEKNIKLEKPVHIVDHKHKGEKFGNYMQLMIACKHYIIPNSSFAWWSVWLNSSPEKIVIAPKNWFNNPEIDTTDLIFQKWILL